MKKKFLTLVTLVTLAVLSPVAAQTKAEIKQQQKIEQQNQIASLLSGQRYKFVATKAITTLKANPHISLTTSEYDFVVKGDTLISHLPFYGRAYSAPYGSSESPLSFISTNFTYKSEVKSTKKAVKTVVKIDAKSDKGGKNYDATLEIFSNGSASLVIQSNDIVRMTFYGDITAL